jgi:hypothetical protein
MGTSYIYAIFFSHLELKNIFEISIVSPISIDKLNAGRYRPLVKTGTQYLFPDFSSRKMASPARLGGPDGAANIEERSA